MSEKKHGALCHWIIERVTAIALIPLSIWLIVKLVSAVGADKETATAFLQNPVNAGVLAIFIIAAFWHKALGIEVVLEDYVHDVRKRKTTICIVKIVSALLAVICLAAIAKLNFA